METKVYYGEYTLEYWISLILKKDIILPSYQRHFVWEKNDVETFIKSLKHHTYAPPVTIGSFWLDGKPVNYIIDGQQRLTSILLAALGYFPVKSKFRQEEVIDGDEISQKTLWTFNELVQIGDPSISSLRGKISQVLYNPLGMNLTDGDLSQIYLGYSYIVPQVPDHQNSEEQQAYYTRLFRNINFQGVELDSLESRRSLYFLNNTYLDWFEPKFLGKIKGTDVDFVRIVSLLTNYYHLKQDNPHNKVSWSSLIPSSYKNKQYEQYYEKYIYSVTQVESDYTEEELSGTFGMFENIFANKDYYAFLDQLDQKLTALGYYDIYFDGIIKADLYLFGLIYYTLFEKKGIDTNNEDKIQRLKRTLANAEKKYKDDPLHKKSPNTKTYLSRRIDTSMNAYSKCLAE